MKILIADFKIQKYGGIVEYVAAMLKAFKELGCEVDVAQINPSNITQSSYDRKIKEFESGTYYTKINPHSQCGGYERDESVPYWRNNYYGYFLPPSNRIYAFDENALKQWYNLTRDVDVILWNFMPTKNVIWKNNKVEFDFWYKFFDLPDKVKQVFLVHDAYFNVRASNVTALKDKIHFLACAHIAGYKCCSEIGIPRALILNPRYIGDKDKIPLIPLKKRKCDFFAAHMFKTMKHMEELISAIPYLDDECVIKIAGSGIEYSYMTSENKIKACYICNRKSDPDLPLELDGKISMWNRALNSGMKYVGQISGTDVVSTLRETKFAIDPSWASHYANFCNTHINGFIIEAMLNGAYPVLRDYRGLNKNNEDIYDPLFSSIRAIYIPHNVTPNQFADVLNKSLKSITEKKFFDDTIYNFNVAKELFSAKKNAEYILKLCKKSKRELKEGYLECGVDSDNVKRISKNIMEDFFHITLPITWKK